MTTIDSIIKNWFNTGFGNPDLVILGNLLLVALSLLLAALFSSIIGFEREYQGHAAGLRTHLLVAVGSAIIMVISVYGFGDGFPNRDPARLAAQVISGIGFLGAGTIVQTGTDIKGLTTATTLWVVMAIGLACGSGNFVIAALGTAVAFGCLVLLRGIERFLTRRNPLIMIVVPSDKPVMRDIILIANRYSIQIRETKTELTSYQDNSALRLIIRCSFASQGSMSAFLDELRFSIRPLELTISNENV